jgi:hypothetical protein
LSVPQRKPVKAPLPLHDLPKVLDYVAESRLKQSELGWFTSVESNIFCVLPQVRQTKSEVTLEALPVNI